MNIVEFLNKSYIKILLPIKNEFSFFILFLLGIMIIPVRLFISDIHYGEFKEILNFIFGYLPRAIFLVYLLTLLIFISKSKLLKCLGYIIAAILFAITLFLNLVFNKTLQPDIITLIAETNSEESTEFLSSFLFTKGGIITVILTIIYGIIVILGEKYKAALKRWLCRFETIFLSKIIVLIVSILCLCSLNFYYDIFKVKDIDVLPSHYGRDDAITSLIYSLYSIRLVNEEMKHAVQVTKKAKRGYVDEKDSLNVIYVIGESYIKSHSQLYGYYLPTTPNLCSEQEKGNLFVFDNVVTPFNTTTLTMKNTFCCNSLRDNERWSDFPYFPAIFKKSGYNVYFWDVQKDDSIQATFEYSLNSFVYNKELSEESYTQVSKNVFQYDDQAVLDFERNVKNMGKHNLIIFHLMGQHVAANKRYPHIAQFEKFTISDIKRNESYIDDSKKQKIAEYDNATYYNDYVLKHIIDLFKNKNTVLLYFSDHGEEVYDYRDSQGRKDLNEKQLKEGLKCQYEVPFIIWCSDKYMKGHQSIVSDIKTSIHKPFQTDNLSNILFKLGSINTAYYDRSCCAICPGFKEQDRIVDKKYNYDKIKKN